MYLNWCSQRPVAVTGHCGRPHHKTRVILGNLCTGNPTSVSHAHTRRAEAGVATGTSVSCTARLHDLSCKGYRFLKPACVEGGGVITHTPFCLLISAMTIPSSKKKARSPNVFPTSWGKYSKYPAHRVSHRMRTCTVQ